MAAIAAVTLFLLAMDAPACQADDGLYALNLYTGRLTSNHWEEFFVPGSDLDFENSYLVALTIARQIGTWKNKASFEIEGQIVKHFHGQTHWEFNALTSARWERFWWDNLLDTSFAFGLGPSYATDDPEIEVENNEETSQFLIYWMMELAILFPSFHGTAFITRLHHRSSAFGLVAEDGGSNALAIGLKWIF